MLSEEIKKKIREDWATRKYSYAALGAKYGVSAPTVGRVVKPEVYEREKEKSKIRARESRAKGGVKTDKTFLVRFYEQDKEVLEHFNSMPNKQVYIKGLIKQDMKLKEQGDSDV